MDESEKAWIRGFSNALAEMHRLLRVGYNSSGVCSVAKGAHLSSRAAQPAGVSTRDMADLKKAGVWSSTD